MWQDLIICGVTPNEKANPAYTHECGFGDLITLVQHVVTDLVLLSTLLAVIAFAYAGFLLMTSGGSDKKRDDAKTVFINVMIGYLWILAAWLLIYTVTKLLSPGFSLLGAP